MKEVFSLQPTLQANLLDIRPLLVSDFESLYMVASDPLIWEQHPQSNRYQREIFQKYFDSAIESKGALLVAEKGSGQVIGCSRYYDMDPARGIVKIGYTFLSRKFWGGDYNRELKRLMIDHALRFVPVILFEVGENNLRSRRALEKIGARVHEQRIIEGESSVTYRIERP